MRACRTSKWRLFRGRPDILTPGRYVFVPPTTPHLPFFHHYGVRDWTRQEAVPWPELGEYQGAKVFWDGTSPVAPPPASIIGDRECLSAGARWPLTVVPELIGGWDSRCFIRVPAIPIDLTSRPVLTELALVQDLLYVDPAAAAAVLQNMLGPTAVITITPNSSSLYPGSLIAVTPTYSLVVISGTTTNQQLALQAMYLGGGPVSYGPFSTSPLWYNASTVIHDRMVAAGVDPLQPVLLTGHSYGGAVAQVLAARYVWAQPGRPVQIATFAAPKALDGRGAYLIKPLVQTHINTDGDPVTQMAPNLNTLLPVLTLAPPSFIDRWSSWANPPNSLHLSASGELTPGEPPIFTTGQLSDIVTGAVLNLAIPDFPFHSIKFYYQRLAGL